MVSVLVGVLLAAAVVLFVLAGIIRKRGVEETFTNESGVVRIKVNIKDEKYNRLAGRLYIVAVMCFLVAFLVAFYYYGLSGSWK